MLITTAKGGDELRHILVAFQSAKPFDGFEDGRSGPPQDHLTTAPPFDIPLHVTRATEQAFDRVGGRERLAQTVGQPERGHRERFLQSFSDARRGARVAILKSSREILQETSGCRDVGLPIGAHDDRADPRALALRKMGFQALSANRLRVFKIANTAHLGRGVGFDHGAGHPLLFLDDAKAPNCRKNNGFMDLGNYSEWPKVAGAVIKAAA